MREFSAAAGLRAVPVFAGRVLALTVMGSFWGLSVQLVTFREQGILRRFRVDTGGARARCSLPACFPQFFDLPDDCVEFFLSRSVFHMAGLGNMLSIFVLVTLGTVTFASLGLIVASVTNTMQETQIINQIIWFVFLFISGATIPFPLLPGVVQAIAVFLPATYLVSGLQRAMIDHYESSGPRNVPGVPRWLRFDRLHHLCTALPLGTGIQGASAGQAVGRGGGDSLPAAGGMGNGQRDLRTHAMKNLQTIREPSSIERIDH